MLLKPMVFENREGARVVIPANTQVKIVLDDDAYSDVSKNDLRDAVVALEDKCPSCGSFGCLHKGGWPEY